jgi:TonB-linked SusC/RagA family outer membrane protein
MSSVFKKIGKLSGVRVDFAYEDVNPYRVTVSLKNVSAQEAVKSVIGDYPLTFTIKSDGKFIVVSRQHKVIQQQLRRIQAGGKGTTVIHGKVVDASNSPMPGVNVSIKGKEIGTTTDANGFYTIYLNKGSNETLVFSFIGMKSEVVKIVCNSDDKLLNVVIHENASELGEVVVTGMFTRRAESFTGSATTYSKEQLAEVGNQNLLKSLKNLDPAFQINESLDYGSDPNRLPEVQMRGQSSFPNLEGDYTGNPNQPLFILDGFETTLQKVYDLDMNRVQSITLLKDAAAKAIYGSKAANGVVVIQTTRPRSGRLQVTYNGNLSLEAPDLTGYNLMNASEKLAFEKERGFYSYLYDAGTSNMLDLRYKQYYDNIQRGVNTYWLSKPLHTGVGTKHSLNLEGGDERMRYQAGVYYNDITGAMKGSDRRTFNLNTTLSYSYKNLIFKNSLEYTKNNSADSPYGQFSDYAMLNQYWIPYDDNGNAEKILGYIGQSSINTVYNPLYNASLQTKLQSKYSEMQDNFGVDWKISEAFRMTGNLSYIYQSRTSDTFYPANHTMFADYDINGKSDQKGKYTAGYGNSKSLITNVGLNFNKEFGKHLLFANVTWNLTDLSSDDHSYTTTGFGSSLMSDISYGSQYLAGSTPVSSNSRTREIGFIGALNYSYADRYLFDASARRTGSSQYGSDKRWGTFWSLGIGWNLHHEKFLENNKWIKYLKLRTSLGYTGSQNFNPFQARARYTYNSTLYDGRFGTLLEALPNNSLRWQRTKDWNSGFDLMLKRFLNLRFDYYITTTDDLLSDISIPPSMGFTTYKENLGKIQNKGYEINLALTPWRDDSHRAWVTFTASALHNKNKIKQIYDIFKSSNDAQNAAKEKGNNENDTDRSVIESNLKQYTNPSTLYYEGQSMTAIWGVRSLGIDPMSGREMYLTKDGHSSYNWNSADQVVIGDTNPKLRGSLGLNAGYEGFTFSLTCSYKLGGDLYNSTLVNKVENVTGWYNLDKRINDAWKNVGDVAKYKKLYINGGDLLTIVYTKPTSRFVEKNNELYISSLNVGYDFYKMRWIKKVGLQRLKMTFYMDELFRFSSIQIERGTSYPFARNFSFAVQASF